MGVEIKIPSLGESISEATVGALLVPNGSQVKMDQEIIEIETEKVNQVLFAPESGELTLTVKEGDVVTIGQVIGSVDTSKVAEAPAETKEESIQAEAPKEAPKQEAPPATPKQESTQKEPAEKEPETLFESVRKQPEAFVEELKSPITQTTPSDPQTAVTKAPPSHAREERKRMSKIRQTIARRLVEAKQTMAMLTTFNEVDMSNIMTLRKNYKDAFLKKHNVKLGFMSFFIKAVTKALEAFPSVNAYIDGEDIVYRKYFDVNVAISSDRGLVVPVIPDCDQLSFAQIEQTIIDLATKAKENKLSMDEMRSGGFTITNGGIFGSSYSTPIVNPPQSAILGMHKIAERPCVLNGEIVARPVMVLALSYDHRIVDGKEGVSFLAHVARLIEDPACLLIDL